ncbi:MAG: PDZ domain-containing protein, partial [Planctomycetota bacterium]
GVKIHGLDDVQKAFEQAKDGFHEITFMGNNRILPLDAEKARLRHEPILQKYHIPAEARLETNP